ncbi:MAG: SPOR domain-containing protein, partial [Bacteroidota bacterium]
KDGKYIFELLPDRTFKVEVGSTNYMPASYQFNTNAPGATQFGQPLFLDRTGSVTILPSSPTPPPPAQPPVTPTMPPPPSTPVPSAPAPPATTPPSTPERIVINTSPEDVSYTARGTSPADKVEYTSRAPRHTGTYYRVQLAAVGRYTTGDSRYIAAESYGRIYTEKLTGRNLTRILVGDYFSKGEADRMLRELRSAGYPTAYIVKYNDGARYGQVR